LAIAGMAQIFGEDEAFKYLKAMYKAPPPAKQGRGKADAKAEIPKGVPTTGGFQRRGGKAAAVDANVPRVPPVGNAMAGIGFVSDIVAEAESGAQIKAVAPCEGTIYEIGALSIVKGARNLDNAKKFVDWALGPKAQALAAKAKQYVYPANTAVASSQLAPKFGEIKFITYDAAKYEKSAARRHLIDRWAQEVGTAPQ
jgi:ABC-type Fe3+ transport system substrate-binding protein